MGIYLNPGNENFRRTLASGRYVDKTMMIDVMNRFIAEGNNYVCVSRPRRFGKTIASNMLAAYYSKDCASDALFAPYKIAGAAGYAENLNAFNVIKIDMNSEYGNAAVKEDFLKELTEEIKEEIVLAFPEIHFKPNDSLMRYLLRVHAQTRETFVILIDEYDVLVREQASRELFDEYLMFLNGLFKSDTLRPAISLAYLTGILPVVRDKIQSKLNNFREYTILNAGPLAEFVGFTGEEVEALCREHGMDYGESRRWYDGYRQNGFEIYSPESVVRSIEEKSFGGYWGQTSSYEAITDRIRQNFAGTKDAVIRALSGENVEVDPGSYLNSMTSFRTKDDLFTYLIHLGYLAYNEDGTCRIPNKEVRDEWFRALNHIPDEYSVTSGIIQSSKKLLQKTWAGDEEAVATALDISHIHVASNRSYNNEDVLQSAIYLAYIYALNRYTVVKEMTAGKGFADVVFIPFADSDPAMIIELKRNGSAEGALAQIKDRQYFASLEHYEGDLLLVGINYDEKAKTHTCQIRRRVK